MSDDHSKVAPPLPIPNRTVKRLRANDSEHPACESRSSSDSYTQTPAAPAGVFLLQGDRETAMLSRRPFARPASERIMERMLVFPACPNAGFQ